MSNGDKTIQQIFREHLQCYRGIFTKNGFELFAWMVVAFIVVDEVRSIKFVWDTFLSRYGHCCLNSVYYFLAYSPWSSDLLIAETAKIVLSLVPKSLEGLPIFLIIDDTLQAKFGEHFAGYQKFYDHCKRSSNNYLMGNNFVCLVVSIPVQFRGELRWLSLPIGFWLYTGTISKLEIASKLIAIALSVIGDSRKAIILCDAWYTKGAVLRIVKSNPNLELVGGVRSDTAIFELPPKSRGKVGRPRKYGQKLDVRTLAYNKNGDYYQASALVMTRLYDKPVEIVVTVKDIETFSSVRMYISTVPSDWDLEPPSTQKPEENPDSNLLAIYRHRWDIEVVFYELKSFWSFGNYMVRTENGISRYMNLMALAFTWVSALPFMVKGLERMRFQSPQENKARFAQLITEELILDSFASRLENTKIYPAIKRACHYFMTQRHVA